MYVISAPSNLSKCKASCKKTLSSRSKLSYFGTFKLELEKLSYLKSASSNLTKCKDSCWTKKKKIRNKNCLIWVFSDLNFEKTILLFRRATRNSSGQGRLLGIGTLRSIKVSCTIHKRKAPQEKNLVFFLQNALKTAFYKTI